MHIRVLQQFLSSLRAPLQSVGGNEIESLAAALGPYAEWDLASFTGFLQAADAYRREGHVRIPGPEDASLESLRKAFAAVREGLRQTEDSPAAVLESQEQAIDLLAAIGKSTGLTVTAKVDKKWLTQQRAAARIADLVGRLRAAAARITGPAAFAAPELQAEIDSFGTLSTADWKAIDQALAFNSSGKGRAKAESALAHLSGHAAPSAKKAKGKAKQPPSPEQILPHVQRLKDRMERSNDRDLFPRSEVDAEIAELDRLDKDLVRAILLEANFSVESRDSKPAMLKKLREFLDAGHRAFEQVQA